MDNNFEIQKIKLKSCPFCGGAPIKEFEVEI